MLRRVALVRIDVSEDLSASITRATKVRRLLVTNAVPSSPTLVTLMMEALSSFEPSVFRSATRRNIIEGASLQKTLLLPSTATRELPFYFSN
jgi:hypothetical protein